MALAEDTVELTTPKKHTACDSCRSSKARCIVTQTTPGSEKCNRCVRLGQKCVFSVGKNRRRRKRTDVRVKELEKRIETLLGLYKKDESKPQENYDSDEPEVTSSMPSRQNEMLDSRDNTLTFCPGMSSPMSLWLPLNLNILGTDIPESITLASGEPIRSGILELLSHFEKSAISTMGPPHLQASLHDNALRLAQDAPFLLHAILAYSSEHLRILKPSDRPYWQAAIYHRQRGLQLYRKALGRSVNRENMDAIFAACMLFAVLAYTSDDTQEGISFVHSSNPSYISWLAVQFGFLRLKAAPNLKPHLDTSVWRNLFQESDEIRANYDTRQGTVGLPGPWIELCGIDESSTDETNPYHAALRACLSLMVTDAAAEAFTKFISFPGRMRPEFFKLVRTKDPVALLIVSHWLSKMCEADWWWCRERARRECCAICEYLDAWPDERAQYLLRVPRRVSEYVSIRATEGYYR